MKHANMKCINIIFNRNKLPIIYKDITVVKNYGIHNNKKSLILPNDLNTLPLLDENDEN